MLALSGADALAVSCKCTVKDGSEYEKIYLDGGCNSKTTTASGSSCDAVAKSLFVRKDTSGTLTTLVFGRPIGGKHCSRINHGENYINCTPY